MTVLKFMVFSAAQSEAIAQASEGREYVLQPRLVDAGDQAGSFVLQSKLKTDHRYEEFWPMMAEYPEMDLDTDVMWPPQPEDEDEGE